MINKKTPPILWSIAGHDSGGGAGLSADQRAADAMGVHLCPVVSAITAQNSQGVEAVFAVDAAQLDAQLNALSRDMPPAAIKTGLLGSVGAIQTVARWVDHLRASTPPGMDPHRHLALIVDPVLGASAGGVRFTDERIQLAYRDVLLPRATVITPNRGEAFRLLGPGSEELSIPALAEALRALGTRGIVITGGDDPTEAHQQALDWLDTPHARGWLTSPRVDTRDHHGTGCTFATGVASAWALGHVEADAVVLAKMLTHHALSHSRAAGQGPGPVIARNGFAAGPAHGGAPLPWLGLGEALPWRLTASAVDGSAPLFQRFTPPADGLYGIVAHAQGMGAALQAGWRCLQLRHKCQESLSPHLQDSLQACADVSAQLFINDHWREALALSTSGQSQLGIHLGQEDLLAMSAEDHAVLRSARHRLMLGISSHSLWELARAAGLGASYIACGPVQATTTKDMPWHPQGLDNLRWWTAHSPEPVVAIGGLLAPADVQRFATAGPAALCVVRGMGIEGDAHNTATTLAGLRQAVLAGRSKANPTQPATLPHPVL
ncbi:bifunctional hydroxymethylpyrimidine kinase/phosphomethylpyrimidine kinase [Aquabacterium sp.]|uniref:bifunctional hydroxymethylpyrimidine kinase/phosphomethylpyrimidine kinase n=1 Tax=Aquabacterium sp. TaxID=1872578 RepID=UPI003D6CC968